MSPSTPTRKSTSDGQAREKALKKKRDYYKFNREQELEKSKERAKRRKVLPSDQCLLLKERHRQAQARYRKRNRQQLNIRSWEYRLGQKRKKAIMDDEEEYLRLMALADEVEVEIKEN